MDGGGIAVVDCILFKTVVEFVVEIAFVVVGVVCTIATVVGAVVRTVVVLCVVRRVVVAGVLVVKFFGINESITPTGPLMSISDSGQVSSSA